MVQRDKYTPQHERNHIFHNRDIRVVLRVNYMR